MNSIFVELNFFGSFFFCSKIKCVTLCQNSHAVASGSDRGTIHIFSIEHSLKGNVYKYNKTNKIKSLDECEGAIVELTHWNNDSQSLLVYGSNKGLVHGWDLRSKEEAWVLRNPKNLGLLETFVVEPQRNWLVTGSNSGYFTLWDLRFNIPVKSWRHPLKQRIYKLKFLGPTSSGGTCILSSSGVTNDMSAWDVETGMCKEYFRISPTDENLAVPSLKPLEGSPLDYCIDDLQQMPNTKISHHGIKSIYVQSGSYLITGGDDHRIRYWDLKNFSNSRIICGLPEDFPTPKYVSSVAENVTVYQEFPNFKRSAEETMLTSSNNNNSNNYFSGQPSSLRPPISHSDTITDIKLVEEPHRMIISASRNGVIKVWK